MSRKEPADWVDAALEAIEEGGLPAVAVEPLARRLGVTKGSFYHHFADRRELVRATLDEWQRRFVLAQSSEFEAVPDARERLHRRASRPRKHRGKPGPAAGAAKTSGFSRFFVH